MISKWGSSLEQLHRESALPKTLTLFNSKGQLIVDLPLPQEFAGFPVCFSQRGYAQRVLYNHALSVGVKVRLNTRVTAYFEDEDGAGVFIGDEERLRADAVIAADGIHSKARKFVTGKQENPRHERLRCLPCLVSAVYPSGR